jgi:hypothetical protein
MPQDYDSFDEVDEEYDNRYEDSFDNDKEENGEEVREGRSSVVEAFSWAPPLPPCPNYGPRKANRLLSPLISALYSHDS